MRVHARPERKTERLVIRCTERTKYEFGVLAARLGVRNYEELLRRLIEKANSEWFVGRIY
jgi:hypothetical protein